MPAPLSCDEFLDAVREAGILEEQSLQPFLAQWQQASPPCRDTHQLAESMQQAGLLTPFQKENLLQGKRRGYIIADKYILLQHLGAGGMGSVWLCEHKVMRRRVAIKVLPTDLAKDPEYLARFHREARAAAALDDPNIVRAFDVDHDEKIHFLVMEYVDGSSLQDLVEDRGTQDIGRAADYIAQAASGLQHAHEAGLVHRDIKPANLLVDRRGTVKILDMGLALFFQEKGKSLTQQFDANAVLGTAEYLAPEQAVDSHGVDIRADIYSLGLTFFFLLTGKSPYGDEGTIAQKLIWHQLRAPKNVREVRPEVPDALADIILKMLAKNPDERFQTPGDVVAAIAAWEHGRPALDPPELDLSAPDKGSDRGQRKAPPATIISKRGPDTIRASDAETKIELDEPEPLGAEPRKKKSRSDAHGPDGKRKASKSDKIALDGDRKKSKEKSSKHRRDKAAAAGFWTTPRLIITGVASSLFLVVGIVIVLVVAFKGPSGKTPSPVAQAADNKKIGEEDKKPPDKGPEKKPEPPKGVTPTTTPPTPPPMPPPMKKEEPKVVTPPPPPPMKKEEPKTPPPPPVKKEEPKTPPPPPPPPPKVKESLAGFFPKPGAVLYYEVANYTGPSKVVVHQKWEFKDKGVIDVSLLKLGMLEKDTLFKGAKIKWMQPLKTKEQFFFRDSKTHVEMGSPVQGKSILWEPVLPLTAADGDSWKWDLPSGETKTYAVVKFDNIKGKRAVLIRDSFAELQGGKIVTDHTFIQGMGEVAKSQTLEKSGSAPQLLAEARLVEP